MKSLRSTINKILKDIKCLKCAVQQLVEGGGSSGGIQTIQEGDNITVDNTDPLNPIVSSTGGELEKITEGVNTGYRIKGRNPANYGDIGVGAFDFSLSNAASTTRGATGIRAVAFGLNNITSSSDSLTGGVSNTNSTKNTLVYGETNSIVPTATYHGYNTVVGGYNTVRGFPYAMLVAGEDNISGTLNSNYPDGNPNYDSIITGYKNNVPAGVGNATLGGALIQSASFCTVVGLANIDVTETIPTSNTDTWHSTSNPRFVVGVGSWNIASMTGTRRNGFVVMGNGLVTMPSLTTALIDAEPTGRTPITKEWFNANSSNGGIATITNTDNNITIDNTDPDNPDINLADNINIGENIIVNNLNSNTFSQFKGATDDNLLYINTAGDSIGIGTNSPTAKLSVQGGFNAGGTNTSLIVNESGSGAITLATSGDTVIDTDTLRIEINGSNGTNGQVLTSDGTIASWQNPTIPTKTIKTVAGTTYTLLESDKNVILHFTSATDVTITVPVGLTIGNRYEGKQRGTGQLIFVDDGTSIINIGASETNKTLEQFSVFGLDCVASDEYDLFGKLELA